MDSPQSMEEDLDYFNTDSSQSMEEDLDYFDDQARIWQEQPENLNPEQMNTLRNLRDALESPDKMASWIQECHRLKLTLKMERLVEYAILKDPSRDTYKYLARKVGADSLGDALLFAVKQHDQNAVEYLLAIGVDAKTKDSDGFTLEDHVQRGHNYREIALVFGFQKLQQLCPQLELGFHCGKDGPVLLNMRLDQLQSDLKSGDNWSRTRKSSNIWFQIPWMNGVVIHAVIRRFEREFKKIQNLDYFDIYVHYRHWLENCSNTGYLDYCEPSYKSSFGDPNWKNSPCTIIVLPCLEVRPKRSWELAKETFRTTMNHMTNTFCEHMIHLERTLDETYYPGLSAETLAIRNDDQVVSKECKETKHEPVNKRPILIVPQLWLLRFGDHLISIFPNEQRSPLSKDRSSKMSTVSDWWASGRFYPYPNAIRMGLIIANHISSFGESRGMFNSPLDYFEIGVVRLLSEVEKYTDPKVPSQPEIKKERDFMHNIADIREELAMIKWILGQQDKILGSLIQEFEKFEWNDLQTAVAENPELPMWKRGWEDVKLSRDKIKEYQERVEKIDRDAVRITGVIQDHLNLKRTHASIRDAHTGLVLSAAVIGFTVITVIFAPLAFMTSLFALPLENLLGNQYQFSKTGGLDPDPDPTAAYTTGYVVRWFFVAEVVSLAVTALLVTLCLWIFGVVDIFGLKPKDILEMLLKILEIFKSISENISKKLKTTRRKLFHKEPNEKAGTENINEENQPGSDQKATGFRITGNFLRLRRRRKANQVNPDERV